MFGPGKHDALAASVQKYACDTLASGGKKYQTQRKNKTNFLLVPLCDLYAKVRRQDEILSLTLLKKDDMSPLFFPTVQKKLSQNITDEKRADIFLR